MARTLADVAAGLQFRTHAWIDGGFVPAAGGQTYVSENPATGKHLADVTLGGEAEVDQAVAAARRAFEAGIWRDLSPSDRKRILIRWADLIDAHNDELAATESLDAGKPISDCRALDIPDTAATIRWHAEAIDKLYDQVAPTVRAPWPWSSASRVGSSGR